jgi:hypothetical protein
MVNDGNNPEVGLPDIMFCCHGHNLEQIWVEIEVKRKDMGPIVSSMKIIIKLADSRRRKIVALVWSEKSVTVAKELLQEARSELSACLEDECLKDGLDLVELVCGEAIVGTLLPMQELFSQKLQNDITKNDSLQTFGEYIKKLHIFKSIWPYEGDQDETRKMIEETSCAVKDMAQRQNDFLTVLGNLIQQPVQHLFQQQQAQHDKLVQQQQVQHNQII